VAVDPQVRTADGKTYDILIIGTGTVLKKILLKQNHDVFN